MTSLLTTTIANIVFNMRLSTEQINTIVSICRSIAGGDVLIWLYGSRLDDTRHGGDIDLLIEPTQAINLLLRARIKMLLEQALSLPVDLLVKNPDAIEQPFFSIVRAQAEVLNITPLRSMRSETLLLAEKQHLANLLEAIRRSVYFLNTSQKTIAWTLTASVLTLRKNENDLFEALAAINERFAKLQDTLGSAMRHSLLLAGEQTDSFMKVLAIFEKKQVIGSVEEWQVARTARNLAAHDYAINYSDVAEHFNTLYTLTPKLFQTARRFLVYCATELGISPCSPDFSEEFSLITQ